MRQKQAPEAKRLAAEHRQRRGLLKEQAKIREAEAAEIAANAERLRTPRTEDPTGDVANKNDQLPKHPNGAATNTEVQQLDPLKGLPATQGTGDTAPQDPIGTNTEDPEILQYKEITPEGDGIELSQDFTLSKGGGDNISGNKELRKEGDDEDKNNSKRSKVPLQIPAT